MIADFVSNDQEKLHSGRTAAIEKEKKLSILNICSINGGHSMLINLIDTKFWKKFIPKMKYLIAWVNEGDDSVESKIATTMTTTTMTARIAVDWDASGHFIQKPFSK